MRVHLYGHGHMGRHHARHLRDLGVSLSIIDPLLNSPPPGDLPDAAVIAVPTALHRAVAEPLLQAGIPCLIEKPLAASPEEAAALARYPRLMVGHIERYNPVIALLPPGVRYLQSERLAPPSPRALDVDVILDLMIHDIDLFLSMKPEDPVVDLRADGLVVHSGKADIVQARIQTAAGRVATLTASRVSRQPVRRLRAFTSDSYWSLDLLQRRAHCVRWAEGLEEQPQEPPSWDALRRELEVFLDAVRSGAPFPIDGLAGQRAVEVAAAIKAAMCG